MRPIPLLLLLSACGPDRSCDFHRQCAWDEICYAGECEPAFDRYYEIGAATAVVGQEHPDGWPWEPEGGPPDLFVELGNEFSVCATEVDWKDYSPAWWTWCDLWMTHDPLLTIDLWDRDRNVDEWVAGWTWDGAADTIGLARSGGELLAVEDDTRTVVFEFWMLPRPR
jgi:hypothetical protein